MWVRAPSPDLDDVGTGALARTTGAQHRLYRRVRYADPCRFSILELESRPGVSMATQFELHNQYATADFPWSHSEKPIARKVFDRALRHELGQIIAEAKKRAAKIEQPSDLWELESYLAERRKYIDRKYDYRYSVLPIVFGVLVREGRIREEELQGLSSDKLDYIRRVGRH